MSYPTSGGEYVRMPFRRPDLLQWTMAHWGMPQVYGARQIGSIILTYHWGAWVQKVPEGTEVQFLGVMEVDTPGHMQRFVVTEGGRWQAGGLLALRVVPAVWPGRTVDVSPAHDAIVFVLPPGEEHEEQ